MVDERTKALQVLSEFREKLVQLPRTRLAAINEALEAGATLDEIGVALGCSRQAVHNFIRYHRSDEA